MVVNRRPARLNARAGFRRINHKGAATIVNHGRAETRDHRYRIDHGRAAATVARKRPG